MRFKTDENLPAEAADLAEVCRTEGRVLVTLDVSFADIRRYPPSDHAGLIVLRPVRQEKPHVPELFRRMIPLLNSEPVTGRLWVVDEAAVRIRG